jgi:1-acyl-sn-glycerol-3-phosphate acyltransferase
MAGEPVTTDKAAPPARKDDIEKLGAAIRPYQPGMRPSWRFVSRAIVGISRLLVGFEVVHPERIPAEGAFLAAVTHTSHLDPGFVGSALGRETYYLARSGILRVPGVGQWCRHFNTLAIRRGESDRQALKMCREVLKAGWPLIFFPEGTRSEDGRLGPIQGGFAMILDGLDVPYLPIVIQDTFKVMPKGRFFPWFAKVRMHVGEPARLPERRPGEPARERMERCRAELERRWREIGAQ